MRPSKDDIGSRLDLVESAIFGQYWSDGMIDRIAKLTTRFGRFERIMVLYVALTATNTTLIIIMLILQLAKG